MSQSLKNRVASALSFAHLAGIGRAKGAEDDERREGESDEDYEKRTGKSAVDEDPEKKDKDSETDDDKKSKAEDDDKQREGESDEDYDKRKQSKADDKNPDADGDDDDEEMRGNSAAASARRRERARCASIFASKDAAKNPVLAASLAFNTTMTRKEALAVLRDTPAQAAAAKPVRHNPALGGGGDPSANTPQGAVNRMAAAMEKAQGKK